MGVRVTRGVMAGLGADAVAARMSDDGFAPHRWSSPAGEHFAWHDHPYYKVLYVVDGRMVLHLPDADDLVLDAGDRMDLEPRTRHAATAGPDGCTCVEGYGIAP